MQRKRIEVAVIAALLAVMPASASPADDQEAKEKKSTVVTLEQLPPAVRKTIEREAARNRIVEIEKETGDGRTTYEAEVIIDGREWEIEVAEDGRLISKEEDREDDDDHVDKA